MSEPTPAPADDRERLVAYLDGELDEQQSRAVEQDLSEDPRIRDQVDQLTRTWDLLDHLPVSRASEKFAQQTLTSIHMSALAEQPVRPGWSVPLQNGLQWAGWTAALSLVALVSFFTTSRWIPDQSQLLVDELPLIENLDHYMEVRDIDFLRQIRSSGQFSNATPEAATRPAAAAK